jgi:predicted molibdopterin-dependent oxidoreductase YjgC
MVSSNENKMVGLIIDGKAVTVKEGSTVLEAARQAGIYIPSLCFHPSLTPYGACRLCIVEIDKIRGFPTSCTTPAVNNMVVRTNTEQLVELRKNIFELILAEHPQQCITCHKNLQCELQEVASHIGIENVNLKPIYKNLPVYQDSPFFERDYNLCILCGRCVRVCQEVRGAGTIAFTYRGSQALVGTAFNKTLEESGCQFCGACVDVCPTGALLDRSSKQIGLPDYSVNTTCPYCGVGCQLRFEVKSEKIYRSVPVIENSVNQGQACVKGRYGIAEVVHNPDRLTDPMVRRNGELVKVTWDEALDLISEKFNVYKGNQFACITSAKLTNEFNYLAQKFTRVVMQTNNVDHCARL